MNQEKIQEGGEPTHKQADIDQEKFHVYHNAAIRGNTTEKVHKRDDQSNDDFTNQCIRQLLCSNNKAFVINYTNDDQKTIAYAVFKSSVKTAYSRPVKKIYSVEKISSLLCPMQTVEPTQYVNSIQTVEPTEYDMVEPIDHDKMEPTDYDRVELTDENVTTSF